MKRTSRLLPVVILALMLILKGAFCVPALAAAGKSADSAIGFTPGNTLKFAFEDANDELWYRFTLESSGELTVTPDGTCQLQIYEADDLKNVYLYEMPLANEAKVISLKSGSYYMKIGNLWNEITRMRTSFKSANDGDGSNYTQAGAFAFTPGDIIYGNFAASYESDYYSFHLDESAEVSFTSDLDMRVRIYESGDLKDTKVDFYLYENQTDTVSLKGGDYLVRMERNGYEGNYKVLSVLKSSGDGGGSNIRFQDAKKISLGKTVYGNIDQMYEADYYSFHLTNSGEVYLTPDHDLTLKIYKADTPDKEIAYEFVYANESRMFSLAGGDYVLACTKTYDHSNYSLETKLKSSKDGGGSNIRFSRSLILDLTKDNTVYGNLDLVAKKDCYKVILPASGTLTMTPDHSITLAIYKASDLVNRLDCRYPSENEAVSVSLTKGTYYIEVTNYDFFNYRMETKFRCRSHAYVRTTITPAGPESTGKVLKTCERCGYSSKVTISAIDSVTLSKTSFVYDGTTKHPEVTVLNTKGNAIDPSFFVVTYSSGSKSVGGYKATVTFGGEYEGSVSKTYKIVPAGTSLSSLTGVSAGFKAVWNKQSVSTTGYQLKYSRYSDMSSYKIVTISSNTSLSKTVTGLSAGKKYYVKIRTYKLVGSTKYYSSWSSYKTVTTK